MDNTIYGKEANPMIGIPYQDIEWEDISGQPFGLASQFNLFVFGDANNIVDVEGAMAVGGSFYSTRSLSVGFQREKGQVPIESSPNLVRYLAGNIVSMKGPLVVIGHAVSGGSFHADQGSTYYIGKNDSTNQVEELKYLYQANEGSPYWNTGDKGNNYIISSYDVPRIIPASRIAANLSAFFQDARKSIETFLNCIKGLNTNGTVTSNSNEWVLTGSNPIQNIFTIDTRPRGILNKGIRFNIPRGSIAIVRLQTGPHAHIQYGLYGEESLANRILYVFEDATNIHMEQSSDIWGSILAPQAMFHGHPTGSRVSGTAVLGGFAVNPNSGFEFHLYPFVGGVACIDNTPLNENPAEIEMPLPILEATPCPTCPEVVPCPAAVPCPTCPEAVPCPAAVPCPTCPVAVPCPAAVPCPTCPVAVPCPTCPVVAPCPTCPVAAPCPITVPCPTCPEAPPCPTCPQAISCPICPEAIPCPTCPICPKCPEYKKSPEKEAKYIAVPFPVPIPVEAKAPVCEECLITQGSIVGCILGCDCCRNHEWNVVLYQIIDGRKRLIECVTICHLGCFQFEVDYDGYYLLKVCPPKTNCFSPNCKPEIVFKNIGVANFTML